MVCDMLSDFSSPYFSTFTSSLQSASASFFLPGAAESKPSEGWQLSWLRALSWSLLPNF